MRCTKCTDGNMSLGILPYVKCNECDGTGLLNDIQNQNNSLVFCFYNIKSDITKACTQKSPTKNDKAFENALFKTQRKVYPITIQYKYDIKWELHEVIASNGRTVDFSKDYLSDAESFWGVSVEEELTGLMSAEIKRI